MRMRLAAMLAVLTVAMPHASAQVIATYNDWCQLGAQKVSTSGLASTTTVQASFPSCTVQVYIHGTLTNATLYSDAGITPLPNPFTANSNGHIVFWASTSSNYDIVESGGTPNSFPTSFTIFNVSLGGGSGGGGGGSPGGLANDVQVNSGANSFIGTSGTFQYITNTQTVNIGGTGGLNVTTGAINFGATAHTIPNFTGLTATILGITCGPGWTAFATDASNGQNLYTCGNDNNFHQSVGQLPTVPGTLNQMLLSNGAGGIATVTGLSYNASTAVTHFPGGGSFDSTSPFSISGTCPSATPLGSSSVGTALIGWDVGCLPKISFNGGAPLQIGLQGLIDYTYLKEDANGCLALTAATGDVGIFRVGAGVLGVMPCNNTTNPSKLNVYNTFSGSTNSEYVSIGTSPGGTSYFVGSDHGSVSGNYHPLYFGAAGITNPFWAIQTVGPLTCLTTNPSCDIGSITNTQQVRNIWQQGFLSYNVIGPLYAVNAGGVQIGLVAAFTSNSPVQVLTATTAQLTGTAGIIAFLTNGTIPSLTIVSAGSGYTAPTCQVSNPPINSGVTATCSVTNFTGGTINAVAINNVGTNSGYESIQSTTVTINDANGTGAVVIPVITATTGFAGVAQNGSTFSPIFDGTAGIRNQIVGSGTTGGQLHDSGIPCAGPRIATQKVYGCVVSTSAGGAGTSVPMQVNMQEATDFILQAITPSATTCPTGAAAGSLCKDTITLPTAFADANYVSLCYPTAISAGVPAIQAILPADKVAASFKIEVTNITAVAAQVTSYDCDLRHK